VPRDVERLAVIAFDNQSSDLAANWAGYSVASLVVGELAGAPDLFAYSSPSMAQAWEQRPTQSLQGYVVRGAGGGWRLFAHRRDTVAGRTIQSYSVSGAHSGELADRLVAAMGRTPAFTSAALPAEAVELHGKWLIDPRAPGATAGLKRAFDLAPGFSEAARIHALITSNERAQAIETVRAAIEKSQGPIPRARLERVLTQLAGEPAARRHAAGKLSDLLPSDAGAAEEAANEFLFGRDYAAGARFYQRALRADPQWGDLNNNAAFGFVLAGDLASARASLARYQTIAPNSGNPLDSLGEVLCVAGRFDESERAFLDSYDKEPALLGGVALRKAAMVRRLSGQQPEADRLFARYAEAQKANPGLALEQAQWDYTSGRQAEAVAKLEAQVSKAGSPPAWSQLAVWRLAKGDAAAAARAAREAWNTAVSPQDRQTAALALFVTQQPDADAATWARRAGIQFQGPAGASLRNTALAYALLLRKQYAAAAPVLSALNNSMHPSRGTESQALLAVALAEAGRLDQAKPLLRTWPVPRSFGDGTFEFLLYPAIRKWMGAS
jgi:Tfp pilus assembly protein PilF